MSDEYPDWQDGPLKVVRNHEGICSIWPQDRENALGWYDVGCEGDKAACLDYIVAHCDDDCRLKNFEPDPREVAFAEGHGENPAS